MALRRAPKGSIPDKLYFKIGEVSKIVGVEPYVLRYWESEFSMVKPTKTRSRHRLYRRRDVETLLEIKRLLHNERFTIDGARKRLKLVGKSGKKGVAKASPPPARSPGERAYRTALGRVKKDLEALRKLLS